MIDTEVDRPHVVLVVPRGESVRTFLYSETLGSLAESARVTLLSVIDDEKFTTHFRSSCDGLIPLRHHPEHRLVSYLRMITDTAHDRWLWSEVAKNRWEIRRTEAKSAPARLKRMVLEGVSRGFAFRRGLEFLTGLERSTNWALRPTSDFETLWADLKPDLVFNCSHVHGPAGELPLKAAHRMGIPTAGFIFSWDNLTSRSRIFVPYDDYLVWTDRMRKDLLRLYRKVTPDRVFVTGTPQFDFHFKDEYHLSREELCRRIGIDPKRPFILYTTGVDKHFPEEHRHVESVIRLLGEIEPETRPQLVVRTYVKGTSSEMLALAGREHPDVVFPPVLWEEKWYTPQYEDLAIYTSLLRHTSLGINAASTVSLELMIHDKPIINLGFDPPGSHLPHILRFARHIDFDHFRPVAQSGATMVARSVDDMRTMIQRGLTRPWDGREARKAFLQAMFGTSLDGRSGRRVAERLLELASRGRSSPFEETCVRQGGNATIGV